MPTPATNPNTILAANPNITMLLPTINPHVSTAPHTINNYNSNANQNCRRIVRHWRLSLEATTGLAGMVTILLVLFTSRSMALLTEDPTTVLVDLALRAAAQAPSNTTTTANPYTRTEFVPSHSAVTINALLFASLSVSMVTVLAGMIGLYLVDECGNETVEQPIAMRVEEDKKKLLSLRSAVTALPVLLCASIVLFLAAVFRWLWVLDSVVGAVAVGSIGGAFVLYFLVIIVVNRVVY